LSVAILVILFWLQIFYNIIYITKITGFIKNLFSIRRFQGTIRILRMFSLCDYLDYYIHLIPVKGNTMKETPQQYTERILGYVQGKKTLKVLASTPKQLSSLLKGVPKTKLTKRQVKDKWSIAEILGHIADTEIVCSFRIRLILGSNGTPIQGFDQDVWAQYSNYKKQDPAVSLEAYQINRLRNIHLLKSLPREMWDNYGMHSERGKESVTRVAEMLAGHDINHLSQIRMMIKGK